ncbi:MAG: hypothetical protein P0Y65_13530 [Candidatus Devosia phytovorans]|uniref:Uncharacterized protein n=1 Tax=Candidatus Devosia phytovorans TaxID=3121372 RepID=A0AAJ5VSC0_9HYPH|nr:hypothetical protein [Devosia sp.]WEK03220.1 MAG: hypothetical protein P0Y65_13530 [Devosia sp.]
MKRSFRVVDLQDDAAGVELGKFEGASPELAARSALNLDVVRSGARADLVAKVYFENVDGAINMVRMYRRVESKRVRSSKPALEPTLHDGLQR